MRRILLSTAALISMSVTIAADPPRTEAPAALADPGANKVLVAAKGDSILADDVAVAAVGPADQNIKKDVTTQPFNSSAPGVSGDAVKQGTAPVSCTVTNYVGSATISCSNGITATVVFQ